MCIYHKTTDLTIKYAEFLMLMVVNDNITLAKINTDKWLDSLFVYGGWGLTKTVESRQLNLTL